MNPSPCPSRARMAVAACAALFLAAALALPAAAQKPKPAPKPHPAQHTVYQLDYTIRQLRGGKVINARHYDLLAREASREATLHVGNHVPIITGVSTGSIQYIPIGVSITAQISPGPHGAVLDTHVRLTAVGSKAAASGADNPLMNNPVPKGFSAGVTVGVIPGAAMTLATLDDVTSNDRYQISVTAIPQKP